MLIIHCWLRLNKSWNILAVLITHCTASVNKSLNHFKMLTFLFPSCQIQAKCGAAAAMRSQEPAAAKIKLLILLRCRSNIHDMTDSIYLSSLALSGNYGYFVKLHLRTPLLCSCCCWCCWPPPGVWWAAIVRGPRASPVTWSHTGQWSHGHGGVKLGSIGADGRIIATTWQVYWHSP